MSTLLLIDKVQRLGADFIIKEEKLYIENAALLPEVLLHELKQNKSQLYLAFKRNLMAKEQGLLTYLSGTLYGCSINSCCDMYLEDVNSQWIAWQEYREQHTTRYTVIGTGNEFAYVLAKIEKFLSNRKGNPKEARN